MSKRWGIYSGYNPHTNPLNKWVEPICKQCKSDLKPWIDWVSHGSIGYCEKCNEFSIVKSKWIPSPHVHSKTEIGELVAHHIKKIQTDQLAITTKDLWNYHENIPLDSTQIAQLIPINKRLQKLDTAESKLIQHLIWSLLLNSKRLNGDLVNQYIKFVFDYPHYLTMYSTYEIWIGDQIDVAKRLEKEYKDEILASVYEIWNKNKAKFSEHDFKMRIGLYIPLDDGFQTNYDKTFSDFLKRIRRRF